MESAVASHTGNVQQQ